MVSSLSLAAANFDDMDDEGGGRPPIMRTGERLIAMGALSRDQLQIGLHEQKKSGQMIGSTLVQLGFITQNTLSLVLAARAGVESVNLKHTKIDSTLLEKLPKQAASRCLAIPLRLSGKSLDIAMADPFDIVAMDEIRRYFPRGIELRPFVASKHDIEEIIDAQYDASTAIDAILAELEGEHREETSETFEHPMIRLVSTILMDAVKRGASDIHFEPESSFVRIRYRLDGVLQQIRAIHRTHWQALSHRVKVMAGMNIADTRSIQDGRFQLQMGGGHIDFRVAIMPTVWGETIVVRLLDHRRSLIPLSQLGYTNQASQRLAQIAEKPQGIILVTGPTGSGKTTTLYSLLRQISTTDVHVATLEEPVEFQLELIRQTAIQESQGLDFAAGVRGLLRMDPDILFIGEIRDAETAQMALRAAMTGHQVYTTLHCNDALGALPRLIDLGLNPRVLAGNLSGIVAQRLVRNLCPDCRRMRPATSEEARLLRLDPANPPMIGEAKGCRSCQHTGRKGRTVVAEVLPITPTLDDLIAADSSRPALFAEARAHGFVTMQRDGIARVLAGEIDLTDLRRAVDMSRGEA